MPISTTGLIANIYATGENTGGVTEVTNTWQQYTYNFTATDATTQVSFLFRQDPSYWYLDNVSVTAAGDSTNLVTNPGFEGGATGDGNQPLGWSLVGTQGLAAAGEVSADGAYDGSYDWADGASGGFDGLAQTIATVPGTTYTLSFWLQTGSALQGNQAPTTLPDSSDSVEQFLAYVGALPAGMTITPPPGPPGAPTVTEIDGSATILGSDNALPVISGVAAPGAPTGSTITIYADGNAIGTGVTTDSAGDWTVTPTAALADGIHAITATETASNGTSSPSAPFMLQITADAHPFGALVVTNTDPSATVTVTASVLPPVSEAYADVGIGSVSADGTTYTVTGTAAQVTAALAGVVLVSASGAPAPGGVTASVTDLDGDQTSQLSDTGALGLLMTAFEPGEVVQAGAGPDTVTAGAAGDVLLGGAGKDVLVGNAGGSTLLGGTGSTTFVSQGGPTIIVGGGMSDIVSAALGDVTVVSAVGGSTLIGLGSGSAVVNGQGSDTVVGGSGAAVIGAASGSLVGLGSGGAVVSAAQGSTVVGGTGSDTVGVRGSGILFFAGAGPTIFIGGSGSSTVVGGAGGSQVIEGGAGGGMFSGGTGGANTIVGGQQATTIFGGGDGDTLFAMGSGGTLIQAGSGNETLEGGASSGNDTFFAGPGSDLIGLGSGQDVVFAGAGSSTVIGGTGADIYAFANGRAGGSETILGFKSGVDQVSLQGYADGAVQRALSSAVTTPGNASQSVSTTVTLSDNTHIIFQGLANFGGNMFA